MIPDAPIPGKKEPVSLLTFPSALLRLILLGGGGLAPAWGPLLRQNRFDTSYHPWDPIRGTARAENPLALAAAWTLPLDALSPWIARLAMVAAWMMRTSRCGAAFVALGERGVNLGVVVLSLDGLPQYTMLGWWDRKTGGFWRREIIGPQMIDKRDPADLILPTLPGHLEQHPPEVALVLALYDVPEVRTGIEELFDPCAPLTAPRRWRLTGDLTSVLHQDTQPSGGSVDYHVGIWQLLRAAGCEAVQTASHRNTWALSFLTPDREQVELRVHGGIDSLRAELLAWLDGRGLTPTPENLRKVVQDELMLRMEHDLRTLGDRLVQMATTLAEFRAAGTPKAIQVWPADEAPQDILQLTDRDGDEDWIALVPAALKGTWIPWAEEPRFGESVRTIDLPSGAQIIVGSH